MTELTDLRMLLLTTSNALHAAHSGLHQERASRHVSAQSGNRSAVWVLAMVTWLRMCSAGWVWTVEQSVELLLLTDVQIFTPHAHRH